MIAEVRVPCGLGNIIPDLFIKFNSLLETACTHDLGTGRYGKAPGILQAHLHTNPHTHALGKLTNTCSTPAHSDTQTCMHLITRPPPPPPPPLQRLTSSHHR